MNYRVLTISQESCKKVFVSLSCLNFKLFTFYIIVGVLKFL